MGLSDAEIIRLAAGVGLERLKRINYDLAKAVCDASENKQIFPSTVVLPSPTPDRIRLNEPAAQSDNAPVSKTRRALQKMVAKEAEEK